MPNLPIEDLGKFGLITDLPPYELPPEAWSRADNIEFNDEGAAKIKGHEEALATLLHAPYWLWPWRSSLGFSWLYAGLTRMGRIVGTGHSDVTRFTTTLGDDDYTATATSKFSGTLLGDLPIWCYDGEVDPPQGWNAGNSRFEDLPNWPANTFADIVTVVDRHVIALRVKKPAEAFDPRKVKWSQAADPGTYPTSWDETDPATGAGEITLAETQGAIVTVRQLGNSTLIYKEDSVITMRFVGGQSTFRFDTVFPEFGCIAREGVVVLENAHMVISKGDIRIHDGVTSKSAIDKMNKRLFFDNLNVNYVDRIQTRVRKDLNEVWIAYADTTSTGKLNKALIWDYLENTWSTRDLQDFDYIALGFIDTSGVSQIIDDQNYTFDSANFPFQQQSATPVFDDLAAIDSVNSKLYKMNVTEQFDGVNMACRLERIGLPIIGRSRSGEWKIDLDTQKFIRRVHFKMKATGPVDIYVGGQNLPNGAVTWVGPYSFDPNTQRFIDCRVNCRFFAIRFESASNISWSLQGYTVDMDLLGEAPR